MATKLPLEFTLLVDDDATTNHVNKRLLDRSGVSGEVRVALNGKEALKYLKALAEQEQPLRPDLILLDLKMDQMDGFLFLDHYTQLPASQKARMLVALTSSASFYDLARLKKYPDVADHIYKPLTEAHVQSFAESLAETAG